MTWRILAIIFLIGALVNVLAFIYGAIVYGSGVVDSPWLLNGVCAPIWFSLAIVFEASHIRK